MHRFYISDHSQQPKTLHLTDNEAAHATRVLRVQPGDEVTVLNGRGVRAQASVVEVSRKHVDLEVLSSEAAPPPGFELVLFQSVIKPKAMDWLVEKATELGVHRIQPLLTERVVSRMDENEASKKTEKWQRTAIEALKQCGSLWLPRIDAPRALSQIIQPVAGFQCHIMASLSPEAGELRHHLESVDLRRPASSPMQVGVWIGPEGDFTREETDRLLAAGCLPVTLGDNVLRSETAAVCTLALVRYEVGLLSGRAQETKSYPVSAA